MLERLLKPASQQVEPPGRYRYDEPITKRIRERDIIISPTVFGALRTAERFEAMGTVHNPQDASAIKRLRGRLTNTGHFHRMGIRLVGGTDCGATDTPFDTFVDELLAYTEAGLSVETVLRIATCQNAELLKLPRVGEIRPGFRADLILVAENPLQDLNALRRPFQVFKSGQLVHEQESTNAN